MPHQMQGLCRLCSRKKREENSGEPYYILVLEFSKLTFVERQHVILQEEMSSTRVTSSIVDLSPAAAVLTTAARPPGAQPPGWAGQ